MTRDQQIHTTAWVYATDRLREPDFPEIDYENELIMAFEAGAKCADKDMIGKACQWLRKCTILADTTIERFKQTMEE